MAVYSFQQELLMEQVRLITEHSPWFILLGAVVAFGYAFLLYRKKTPWSKKINNLLFGVRFLVVFLITFLLTGPLVKLYKNYLEEPAYVIAVDNSQSVRIGADSSDIKQLSDAIPAIASQLSDNGLETELRTLEDIKNAPAETISFDASTTNLHKLLSDIESDYENRNLAGVILISDGIYNQGMDPLYGTYSYPVYSVGTGDTVPKQDINVKSVHYNKIAYAGNKFPVVAEVHNNGFSGEIVNLNLMEGEKKVASRSFTLDDANGVNEIEFLISAEAPGLKHYKIEAETLSGEYTTKNNTAHVYIEVIEDKQKVLIAAHSPHPDIKAIRSALESRENFEIELFIPSMHEEPKEKFDLVIFHQLPTNHQSHELVKKLQQNINSSLFIIGSNTNINLFNNANSILNINARGSQTDNVTPSYRKDFERFKLDQEDISLINQYPPVTVPFGSYSLKGKNDIVLMQKVGNVETDKPLLITRSNEGKKSGVMAGEGLWQWRLQEFAETGSQEAFDKFFSNLIQYLSSREDKRKFLLYPVSNEFDLSDRVVFEAEIYNDIYEKVYGKRINLEITDEEGNTNSYSFTNSEGRGQFEVKGLGPGVYKYKGSVNAGERQHSASGEFIIKEVLLEAVNTTADHRLLRTLAQRTGGQYFHFSEVETMPEQLTQVNKTASIIHTNEEFREFINLRWLFFVLLAFITFEWGMRKYLGSY